MASNPAIVVALLAGLAATGMALAPPHASAQSRGMFGSLFGLFGSRDDRFAPPTSYTNAYAGTSEAPVERRRRSHDMPSLPPSESWSGHATYCVRLCDGRYFPLSGAAVNSRAGAARMCSAMCPGAKTAVFHGSSIDDAVSGRERYADLDNAYLYRERIVENCTCNGRDAFGLAQIDVNADPTLRPGDIVASGRGLAVFRGSRGGSHSAANFTPIENSSRLSADVRRKLRARVSRGD